MARVVIDPITRIEGHLKIEVEVANGKVTNAWSSSTLFRGIEIMLQGRDPRDAYLFTQRACGVCTYIHGLASIRAVDAALGVNLPITDGSSAIAPWLAVPARPHGPFLSPACSRLG